MSSDVRCYLCGILPPDTDVQDHLSSSIHRNAVELDAELRARVYWPKSSGFTTFAGDSPNEDSGVSE